MSKTVIALFDNMGQAEDAADALRAAGFGGDRIEVQIGEDFVRRAELPPPAHQQNLWDGIKRFFDELGVTTPAPRTEDDYQPIEPNDGVVMLETSDDQAEAAAEILDRGGAISLDERKRWREDGAPRHQATGLEPETSGQTPPDLESGVNRERGDVDERSLASTGPEHRPHRARIYGETTEPFDSRDPETPARR